MTIKKEQPTPYYHKPPMRLRDFEIYHNKDYSLEHVVKNSHPYYEFYFLISGDVTYIVEEKEYYLKSGDVILISPHQEHEAFINVKKKQPYERYVLWLNPEYLKRLSSKKTNLLLPFEKIFFYSSHLTLMPDMKIIISNLLEHIFIESVSNEYGADLLTNSHIIELLVHIAKIKLFQRIFYDKYIVENKKNAPIIMDILFYINENIYENILIEDISSQFFISRSHLSKIFQEDIGISIHQFIIKKKLFLAKQDLLNGQPVNDVCTKYNFGNYSSFFRAFKLEFGQSPRDFKRSYEN